MFNHPSRAILPDPPEHLKDISRELAMRIRQRIESGGPIPFSAFMEAALYEPGLGYYSGGLQKFGEDGDFITAPELGSVFASCMALQAAEIGTALGAWDLVEIGAGTGALARGLLEALPEESLPRRYLILERSADLRAVQAKTLDSLPPERAGRVEWLDQPPESAWQGVLIANEVVDALPVERFEVQQGEIRQLMVDDPGTGFEYAAMTAPPDLAAQVRRALNHDIEPLPEGFRSEICTLAPGWLAAVTASLARGAALFIDYGYPRREYYLPERHDGTLICHFRHRAHSDPFVWPGLQDISAFVDFTALAQAGEQCGLTLAGYTSQAMFLIGSGLEEVTLGLESLPDRERLERAREIRELTMPGAMGEKFQVMGFTRDFDTPLRGFSELNFTPRLER